MKKDGGSANSVSVIDFIHLRRSSTSRVLTMSVDKC